MNSKLNRWTTLLIAVGGILLLILDAQTALQGAYDGVEISIHTVLPTLFPYIFLTSMLNNQLLGRSIPVFKHLGKLCGIPDGAESVLLLGLIGGYPVGAQLITDSYHAGKLDKKTAHRMLGFCSNAGPAFIIGMLSTVFINPAVPFILWSVHIVSAFLVGLLLPGKKMVTGKINTVAPIPVSAVLERSIKIVARICGWVILFRLCISVCQKWFLHLLPLPWQTFLIGMVELANGCVALTDVTNECIRMILSAPMLAFGGLCVSMQTISATNTLGIGMYFPGKILQALISSLLVIPFAYQLYPHCDTPLIQIFCACFVVFIFILIFMRKNSGILCRNDV